MYIHEISCNSDYHPFIQTETRMKLERLHSEIPPLEKPLHATHLLKFLDKMYKYEMDPTKTVGATCRCYRADTGCGTDGQMEWNQYTPPPPNNFVVQEV